MSNEKRLKEKNKFSISSNIGIELLNCGPTRTTGFSLANFEKGQKYEDKTGQLNYILVIFSGGIKLSCKLFHNKVLDRNMMVFVPKDSTYSFDVEKDTEMMFFAFSTTIIRTDKEILNYFCVNARKFKCVFNALTISSEMKLVVEMIRSQLLSKKLKNVDVCDVWNSLFFHTVQSFYSRSEIINFLRPIFSSSIDFKMFVESNYIESAGNVTSLIQLSGIPYARFHALFYEKYGMTAKAWLDEKARNRILLMSQQEHITVTDMAKVFNVSTQRFCGFCRRLFGCTPRELIALEQAKRHKK